MIIDKYFSSLRNFLCHFVEKFVKNLLFKLKTQAYKTSCITQTHFDILRMLISACLHGGGSWRPVILSLVLKCLLLFSRSCFVLNLPLLFSRSCFVLHLPLLFSRSYFVLHLPLLFSRSCFVLQLLLLF